MRNAPKTKLEISAIAKKNQPTGIRKKGSTKVPSSDILEPIKLKVSKHPILIKRGVKTINFFSYSIDLFSD